MIEVYATIYNHYPIIAIKYINFYNHKTKLFNDKRWDYGEMRKSVMGKELYESHNKMDRPNEFKVNLFWWRE